MEKRWFAAKKYGWGWYPIRWQGWLIILGYALIFGLSVSLFTHAIALAGAQNSLFLTLFGVTLTQDHFFISFLVWIIFLISSLIYICYKTGEKPGWHWGS